MLNYAKIYDSDKTEELEDEILYGNAGYIYCLLLLRKNMGLIHHEAIDKALSKVVEALMVSGVNDSSDFLQFFFPKKRKSSYMGAAHGTIGIVYLMLKAL